MTVFSDADNLKVGASSVTAAYVGATQVWPRWKADTAGLFGGMQVIGSRAGFYPNGAIATSANWGTNSRRAHNAEWPTKVVANATNARLVWFNDINHQVPPTVIALTVSSGSLGGTFVINSTSPSSDSTTAIAYNAADTTVKAAIETLDGIGTVKVTKTGTTNAPVWTVEYQNHPSPAPVLTLNTSGLTGTGAAGTVTPVIHATLSAQMALRSGSTIIPLDLRTTAAPNTSLGDGSSTPVNVAPYGGIFGVPSSATSFSRNDTPYQRIFVDRGNDTTTHRWPWQASQVAADGVTGASQNVTGPGTSYVQSSTATWSSNVAGTTGVVAPTALLGNVSRPITNVLVLGDSVENRSLDDTARSDTDRAYVRRAINDMRDNSGMEITAFNLAQGNERLDNLLATLQDTSSVRRALLSAGCWTHVFIGFPRNDIQDGRSVSGTGGIIDNYTSVVNLVRSLTPAYTKVFLGTAPPYTNSSNVRLQSTNMDALLTWQLGAATSLFDHVFDVGAAVASASNRQLWAQVALGDASDMIQDGIHPGQTGHAAMAAVLTSNTALWRPTGY